MPQPLTPRDLELLKMPTIASQMPVSFTNGAIWSDLKGECKNCGCELPDHSVRGHVAQQTPKMFSVEAVGVCDSCRLITRFLYRLHDDMRITGPRDGRWQTWMPRSTLFERVRTLIGI